MQRIRYNIVSQTVRNYQSVRRMNDADGIHGSHGLKKYPVQKVSEKTHGNSLEFSLAAGLKMVG